MREVHRRAQGAAAEVEPVELDFLRGVGERERADEGAQQRGLAGPGAADDQEMAGGSGEVVGEDFAALFEGLVDQAEGDGQPAGGAVGRGVQAAFGRGRQGGQELVEGGSLVQRG